jgi:hypothetical protein
MLSRLFVVRNSSGSMKAIVATSLGSLRLRNFLVSKRLYIREVDFSLSRGQMLAYFANLIENLRFHWLENLRQLELLCAIKFESLKFIAKLLVMNGKKLNFTLKLFHVKEHFHFCNASHLKLFTKFYFIIEAIKDHLLNTLVSQVTFWVYLVHQRFNNSVFLKNLGVLLKHRFHTWLIFNKTFRCGLFSSLE